MATCKITLEVKRWAIGLLVVAHFLPILTHPSEFLFKRYGLRVSEIPVK